MIIQPVSEISSYHAHVYFRSPQEREAADQLQTLIGKRFLVRLGGWHDPPIGPHHVPMYQIAFATEVFTTLVPWLMLNRMDLVVLVHPNTRNARRDHLVHAVWLGEVFPIMRPEQLPEDNDH